MARKTKKTPEQIVREWVAGSIPDHVRQFGHDEVFQMGWEAGQTGSVEWEGARFERFEIEGEGYVVIQWSPEEGLISVGQRHLERWEREELGI